MGVSGGPRKTTGYATICSPTAPLVEVETFTCFHCQKIVFVKPFADPADMGGLCKICMNLVCPACDAKGVCTPWEKSMEQMEAVERFRRSAGL